MNQGGEFFGTLLFFLCVALPIVLLVFGSVVWAYADAEKRGKPGCLVALLVLLATWPVGLIIWLLIRPQEKRPTLY